MDNATLAFESGELVGRRPALRVGSVLLALALVFAALVLVQHRAEAAPVRAAVAAAAVAPGAVVAQIDVAAFIRSIVCPLLLALRNGPFGAFIGPFINALLVAFGCVAVSGAP